MLKAMFRHYTQRCPLPAMVRSLLEYLFGGDQIDALFEATAKRQYTKELLFSTLVELMSLVVWKIRPSVHAAYQACEDTMAVSKQAVYDKLKGVELEVSAAVVRQSAATLAPLIDTLGGGLPSLLEGYDVRILDGNVVAATEHRLKVLRDTGAGPLPGKSLAILDPARMLICDLVLCEDGHAQERALLDPVLAQVKPGQLYIKDRNFCVGRFLYGIAQRGAFFLTRQHQSTPAYHPKTKWKAAGCTEKGERLEERWVEIYDEDGHALDTRQVRLFLAEPTRDGETVLYLLTNLPRRVRAKRLAALYLERWTVERVFQILTVDLRCEIETLGFPPAALFSFSLAVVAYNLLATVRAALRATQGVEQVEEEVSDYYLVDEIAHQYRTLLELFPPRYWKDFPTLSVRAMARWLQHLARHVKLALYRKHPRGPKKSRERPCRKNAGHVATARLLNSA